MRRKQKERESEGGGVVGRETVCLWDSLVVLVSGMVGEGVERMWDPSTTPPDQAKLLAHG